MSWFEITLIILVCLSPIVALVLVLINKLKKKDKPQSLNEKEPVKDEQKQIKEEPAKQQKEAVLDKAVFNDDGFKEYLNHRLDKTDKPKQMSIEDNMKFPTRMYNREEFEQMMRPVRPNKTISEQIKSLSPELKALMIAGVFNKKDY